MSIVEQLKEKYGPASEFPLNESHLNPTVYLFQKFAYKVEKGWYGFNLGKSTPFKWAFIIEEFLEWLETEAPNYKIRQCKLKMGGLRLSCVFEVDNCADKVRINNEIEELEKYLFDERLIY